MVTEVETGRSVPALTPAAARVLDVASRLFYERGIHATGVDAVALAAGVTKKTIYDRFGSKDTLIAVYLDRRDREYRQWLTDRVAAAPGTDPLLTVLDGLEEWLREHGTRGCAFVNAVGEIADPAHPAHAIAREHTIWLRDYLEQLAAGHDDPAALAAAVLTLHEGAIVLHSAGAAPDAVRAARGAVAALLDGGSRSTPAPLVGTTGHDDEPTGVDTTAPRV